jgi:hypothetical protein
MSREQVHLKKKAHRRDSGGSQVEGEKRGERRPQALLFRLPLFIAAITHCFELPYIKKCSAGVLPALSDPTKILYHNSVFLLMMPTTMLLCSLF